MSKVVLITGASSGLGLSLANYLVNRGYIVYGSSRKITTDHTFKTIVMDVCDADSVDSAVKSIVEKEGKIDVVINNAGLGIAGPVENLNLLDVLNVFQTNVMGVIRVMQAVLPYMRSRQSGLLLNISSIAAEMGLPYRGAYSASKAALDRVTEALRVEVKKFGIKVCLVQPGGVVTDINKNRIHTVLPENSPYKESFQRTYDIINESVSKGLSVEVFGPEIEKIINSDSVKRVYRIGKPTEKLSVQVKKVVPDSIFDNILTKHYKI